MSRALTEYAALAAKVKAMYGKRLTASDFRRMAALPTVDGVMEYLRLQSGWHTAVDNLEGGGLDANGRVRRPLLEWALQDQIRAEYTRLLHFVPRADKKLTAFPVLMEDARGIMGALRRLQAGLAEEIIPLPRQLAAYSWVDHEALRTCTDFDGLLAAARRTIYYAPLLHLRPERSDELPDYTATEALLKSTYYAYIYRQIHKNYGGQTKDILLKSFGREVDMLNLLHALRLKRFFPDDEEYYTTLFPFHYRLKPEMLHALCAAATFDAALQQVEKTPYGPIFQDMTLLEMEVEYRRQIYLFNKRQLSLGTPSVYMAVAYLNLKDQEIKALINVIESVNYGIPYVDSVFDLIGK